MHECEIGKGVDGYKGCDVMDVSRRSFVGSLIGMGSLVMGVIIGAPLFRFVLYPVFAKSAAPEWSEVGDVSEFDKSDGPVSKTITLPQRDGWREAVSTQSIYVSRTAGGQFQILSAICPHLGCSVAWQPSQAKFICPCHGGQFSADGGHISGPPPRSLDNLKTQVKEGKLQVQFEYFRTNVPKQELLS